MWIKSFDNTNIPLDSMQTLHGKIKETYGENLLEVFDYIPPEGAATESSCVEVRFLTEPEETATVDTLVNQYKVRET